MGIRVPVALRTVEDYVRQVHGSPRQLTLIERTVLRGFVREMVRRIEDAWPVDTSWSRDHFRFTITGKAGGIGFTIINDVGYVQYIHLKGTPPEPPLWTTLIPRVVLSLRDQLISALKAAVDATELQLVTGRLELLDVLQVPGPGDVPVPPPPPGVPPTVRGATRINIARRLFGAGE